MIALLSVGEALLAQARDRDLVAGGDLVLLPEGVDPAVLKVNGVTGLFLTIPHAGFVVRDILEGPRVGPEVAAAAPEIRDRVVYLRVGGKIVPANASAGIPSLDHAARVTQAVPGDRDSGADRAWVDPPADALFDQIDHFHAPPAAGRTAWAEWDYFNFLDPATGAYGYVTVLAGGEGRGAILLRLVVPSCHSASRRCADTGATRRGTRSAMQRAHLSAPPDDLTIRAALHPGDLSLVAAAQRIGPARIRVQSGRYHITVDDPQAHLDLWLTPARGFYLPPGETSEAGVISGYVVPAVRGWIDGEIRTGRSVLHLARAPAYHDHNWGTWRSVTWEWGEASGGGGALLYGALHVGGEGITGAGGRPPALFVWAPAAPGRGGLVGVFPIHSLTYDAWHPGPVVAGRRVAAPGEVRISAGEGGDALTVRIRVQDALGSLPAVSGASGERRSPAGGTQVFLQLRGRAEIRGVVDGHPFAWEGPAASETFVAAGGE